MAGPDAGASAVKLQTFRSEELVSPVCPAPAHVSVSSLLLECQDELGRRALRNRHGINLRLGLGGQVLAGWRMKLSLDETRRARLRDFTRGRRARAPGEPVDHFELMLRRVARLSDWPCR